MKLYQILSILFTLYIGTCEKKPSEPIIGKELELLWSFEYIDESISISSISNSPTIYDPNTVFLSIDQSITSINSLTGLQNWRYKLPDGSPIVTRKLLIYDQYMYQKHDKTNKISALNVEDGSILWYLEVDNANFFDFRSDAISSRNLYLSTNDQRVIEVSKNGNYIRDLKLKYNFRSGHFLDGNLIIAHSYSDKDRAQHPNQGFGKIISYDLDADSVNWEYDNEYGGYTYAPILLENGIIYAGSTDGVNEFTAINAETGEVIWRRLGQESWAYTLGTNAIYINDGTDLVALNKADGRKLWQTLFKGRGFDQANVAYLDGYVYHSHSGAFYVLDAFSGEIVYSSSLPDGSYSGNVSAGYGKVFVQSYFNLFCYKAWEELP